MARADRVAEKAAKKRDRAAKKAAKKVDERRHAQQKRTVAFGAAALAAQKVRAKKRDKVARTR